MKLHITWSFSGVTALRQYALAERLNASVQKVQLVDPHMLPG